MQLPQPSRTPRARRGRARRRRREY